MAAQRSANSIFGEFEDRVNKSVAENADKAFVPGNQPIVPGITNGIARLTSCSLTRVEKAGDNKGKPLFMAYGTVLEPFEVEYKGAMVTVQGMTTKQMVMFEEKNDDYGVKTYESCANDVMNILKGLGVTFKPGDRLQAVIEALNRVQKKPVFRLSTRVKQRKDGSTGKWVDTDGVIETWHGQNGLENYTDAGPGAGVHDGTGTNGKAPTVAAKITPANPSVARGRTPPPDAVEPAPDWAADGADLEAMAAAAEEGDEGAQARFDELASEVGINLNAPPYKALQWEQIPAAIQEAREARESEAGGDPVPEGPDQALLEVGNTIGYKPNPRKKAVLVKVLKVYKNGTADVQELTGAKAVHKAVTEEECEAAS